MVKPGRRYWVYTSCLQLAHKDIIVITIISSNDDVHAQAVMRELSNLGVNANMLDLSNFPKAGGLTFTCGKDDRGGTTVYRDKQGAINFKESQVVWWRRPQPYSLDEEVKRPEDIQFCYTECEETFAGLWQSMDCFWINEPTREEVASRKCYQLGLASEMGFTIPDTCITNEPMKAKAFIDKWGNENTVYKPFTGTEEAWRETRVIKVDELDLLDSVRFAPVIFQEYIRAEADLRITVVDKEIFAAAIYPRENSYQVDFRMAMDEVDIKPVSLPSVINERLLTFMEKLGLVYGAIDMRLTPEGNYVFLEINPTGQWLFIEEKTRQPIARAMASLMVKHDNVNRKDHLSVATL